MERNERKFWCAAFPERLKNTVLGGFGDASMKGGFGEASTTSCAWGQFKELASKLTGRTESLVRKGRIYRTSLLVIYCMPASPE